MGGSDSRPPRTIPSFRWKSLIRWSQIASCGMEAGPPEFKVPPSSGRSSVRFSACVPRSRVDPGGTPPASPWRPAECWIPSTVTRSPSTSRYLRGYIILQAGAFRPVARRLPCVRFGHAVSPSFGIQAASGFMLFTRCLPRMFHGLSNMSATLGNGCWLGFVITGLSPDKKRLASLGAQR
jgi:hypothetical protein